MNRASARSRARGMSLVELMVAVMIFAVVMVVVVQIFGRFGKVASQLRQDVFADKTFAGFSQRFVADVMASDVGLHFLNIPVRFSGCGQNEACVRRLNSDGSFSNVSGVPGVSTIQFFRDETGSLENLPAYEENNPVRIMRSRPIAFSPAALAANLYVTWPLVEDPSSAFVMMTRKTDSSIYFRFPEAFSSSNPPASVGNWTIAEASSSGVDLRQVTGSLFVVYNAIEPMHYFIQVLTRALDCSRKQGERSVCAGIADALHGEHGIDLLAGKYYALDLQPINPAALNGFVPTRNVVPVGQWWPPQTKAEYLFPMRTMSISDGRGKPVADVRRVIHFYHSNSLMNAKLFAVPVQLQSYRLDPQGKSKRIIRTDFFPRRESVVLYDLAADAKIWIGRKIGTREVTVFRTK